MYRHRGHRYISIREFDRAIADLEHAVQLMKSLVDGDGWDACGAIAAEADLLRDADAAMYRAKGR